MLEKDHGHIVTIASLAGHVGISKLVDYCSSKFAAVGFDEAIRLELEILGSQNVLTTCICPFFIQSTGMFEDVSARLVCEFKSSQNSKKILKKNWCLCGCLIAVGLTHLFFYVNVIESTGSNCNFFPIYRWVPTLTSDDVADRIVSAIQKKEKLAVIPGYLQFMLCIKWYVFVFLEKRLC